MYSFPNLEPIHCSMSGSNCCFLTCIQISQDAGKVVWFLHLFKNFPQFVVIHTVKGFGIVNKAEVGVFLELFCFSIPLPFLNPAWTSGSSQFTCLLLLRYTNMTHQGLLMSRSAVTLPSPLHSPCPWPVDNSTRGSKSCLLLPRVTVD